MNGCYGVGMNQNDTKVLPDENEWPREKSIRIILFADLRDSTDILLNFEKKMYKKKDGQSESDFDYGEFILDVHETSYRELYLNHNNTFAEIYGDGVMGVFPKDNTKYILENLYRLSKRMRGYNDTLSDNPWRPKIDLGFGLTVGEVSFVYYPMDQRFHPVGNCIHEAARIEGVSKLYDARILVSHRFFNYTKGEINSDPRFSYRFIDRAKLKDFKESVTLYEILVDNDPRFEAKKSSSAMYYEAYSKYREKEWKAAMEIFTAIYEEYGLGIGNVMAKRCNVLLANPPDYDWDGIWNFKQK
jgi:class 3 adenylate cyclase